jgi:hypothetical protein
VVDNRATTSGLAMARIPRSSETRILVWLTPVALITLIAGTSMPSSLLPYYGRALLLSPDILSLIFSTYLVVIVVVLAAMARPAMQTRPTEVLMLALLIAVAADLALAAGTVPSLIAGRVLNGLSGGLGIGAASALALALRGERSRGLAATGTILGGAAGITLGALLGEFSALPGIVPYAVHGLLTVGVIALLAYGMSVGRAKVGVAGPSVIVQPAEVGGPDLTGRYPARWVGYLLGVIAWIASTIVVALVPIAAGEVLQSGSLIVASLGAITCIGFAAIGQMLFRGTAARSRAIFGLVCTLAGAVILSIASSASSVPVLLLGAAGIGLGQGSLYRVGLLIGCHGLPPRDQGSRASRYAFLAYGVSAAHVSVCGVLMKALGTGAGLALAAVSLIPLIVAAMVAVLWKPRTYLPSG